MTLTFELDLETIKLNYRSIYLSQRSFSSNVIVLTHTRTDRRCKCTPCIL